MMYFLNNYYNLKIKIYRIIKINNYKIQKNNYYFYKPKIKIYNKKFKNKIFENLINIYSYFRKNFIQFFN